MNFFKYLLIKILQFGDSGATMLEKAENFSKTGVPIGIISFIIASLTNWYIEYQGFTILVVSFVFINASIGGVMHWKKLGDFSWEQLLLKTSIMILVIALTYFVLEGIISTAGGGNIVNAFRASCQVATLLYPGMKIIKSMFILSNGEHPPQWLMERLYNFKKNGDLKQFLTRNENDDTN